MTDADQLYAEWTDGDSTGMRPKRVQAVRDDLAEVTGLSVPPTVPEIEGWLERMHQSGVLTKKLRAAAEGSDDSPEGSGEELSADSPTDDSTDA